MHTNTHTDTDPGTDTHIPLILDLDGTLVRNDLTQELVFESLFAAPLQWPGLVWLGRTDKPEMKRRMLELTAPCEPEHLPYQPEIVELARAARAGGREVWLCSGSHEDTVDRITAHLPWMSGGWGTRAGYNMTSARKAAFLRERFPQGFDYAGNSTQDFAVWEAARRGYAMHPPPGTDATRTASGEPVDILVPRGGGLGLEALPRPWVYAGAALVPLLLWLGGERFLPALFHALLSGALLGTGVGTLFRVACIRHHRRDPARRDRPLPSGRVSPARAMLLGVLAVLGAFALAALYSVFA